MNLLRTLFQKEITVRRRISNYIALLQNTSLSKLDYAKKEYLYDRLYIENSIIIGKSCTVGENLSFPHMQNIVIGEGVKIGDNCTIYQDVTIGQNHGKYPEIGCNVTIYAGAKLFGGINIGNNVTIGANSVVNSDIPDNAIVAGIPAKIVRVKGEKDEFNEKEFYL